MRPGLRHFFDTMTEYFADPSGLERLRAAHPGWSAPASRMVLYGEFVQAHLREVVEKLYPLVKVAVGPERWEALAKGYVATRPARHFEMNQAGESFPAYVADLTAAQGLPEFLPALARFEWADWAVYASQEQVPARVERLTANPTLQVLQHPYKLCAYVRNKAAAPAPAAGEEIALLWRHPRQLNTWFMGAQDRSLLALKMAVEGLSVADVTAATGLAEQDVRSAVDECVSDGLLLAP